MTDESIMPFGMHVGKKLANVPASYLLWLYNTNTNISDRNRELMQYIEENMDALKQESK